MQEAIKYYVSDHVGYGLLLHVQSCKFLPPTDSRAFIGSCYSSNQACTVAAAQYAGVKHCPHCIPLMPQPKVKSLNQSKVLITCEAKKPQRKVKAKLVKAVRHFPA